MIYKAVPFLKLLLFSILKITRRWILCRARWIQSTLSYFFSVIPQFKSGLSLRLAEVSISHTVRYTPGTTRLYEWSDRFRGCYPHNTQQTNIHVLSGIWTRNPRNKTTEHLRFRPHGPQSHTVYYINLCIVLSFPLTSCNFLPSLFFDWNSLRMLLRNRLFLRDYIILITN